MILKEPLLPQLLEVTRQRLEQRVNLINRIYRLDGGREIIGYHVRRRKSVHLDELRLTLAPGEVLLARFTIHATSPMSNLKGKIVLVNGQFSFINFNNPTEHADLAEVKLIEVKIGKTFDPDA